MDRTILHSDCNSFYASVECFYHPELKNVPMAVCGDPGNRHGIILAKNEPAKRYRIQTAEPIWQALQKCPELVLRPAHHERYREFSDRINRVYLDYTNQVEPFSIDESWLDVSGSLHLFGSGKEIADLLRRRIREEIGVTISVGVSFNKTFAKMGSDYKKPDATTMISRENFRDILYPLPVSAMLSVGANTAAALEKMRIHTIGNLAEASREYLVRQLGKLGGVLYDHANGLDDSPVRDFGDVEEPKSIGNSITFKRDLVSAEDINLGITTLADSVAARLRKHGMKCWTVQITIKNPSLKSITRQTTLPSPSFLMTDLRDTAMRLIRENWRIGAPVRLLGLTASTLVLENQAGEQLSLFRPGIEKEERRERLEKAVDEIRQRMGGNAISFASVVNNDIGIDDLKKQEER